MKRTLAYLKPYRGTVAAGLAIKFVASALELFLPFLLEYVIDACVPNKDGRMIFLLGGAMLLCSILSAAGNVAANRLTVRSSGNMTHDLRYDLFAKTCVLRSEQVDGFGMPSLISRLTSDTYYVNQMVVRTLRLGVRAPILILGGMVMTFLLDPVLACVLLACTPVVALVVLAVTRRTVPAYAAVRRRQDKMVESIQENVTGVRVVKALSKTDYETARFGARAEELSREEFRANRISELSNPLATLALNLGLVAVIALGAYRGTDAGVVLAFLSYFVIILNAMIALSKIFVVLSRGAASAARLEQVLGTDCTEPVFDLPGGDPSLALEFEDVRFSYNGVEDDVRGVSFALRRGGTLGIIGGTGSGKSTLIALMMRFYEAGSGRVLVFGEDVRSLPAPELRKKFGVAFQSDFLMSASVRENVDYGRDLTDEEIDRALRAAQAKEFVSALDGGKNFVLAEKAANLSGGQKQRLIVARALAGDPEILVLDDSSSALDYATDAALRRALAEDYPNATKVVVAQRVSAVRHADLILVMEGGALVGRGTHGELMRDCPEYREIAAAQTGESHA